jgi:hypothetical protein
MAKARIADVNAPGEKALATKPKYDVAISFAVKDEPWTQG